MASTSGISLRISRAVALGEAAGHDERPRAPALLELRQLENRVDRFLARPVDEGAGVDDEALGGLGGRRRSRGRPGEHAQHQLGVDLVLGAAEGGEMDFHDAALMIPHGGRVGPPREPGTRTG